MTDNRVVIKINYDKDKAKKPRIEPKVVTVWHTRRILVTILILLFLCMAIYFLFSGDNDDANKHESVAVDAIPIIPPAEIAKPVSPIQEQAPSNNEINTKQTPNVKRPDAIILDKRIVRASLGSAPVKDEPGEPIKSPVMIGQDQTQELFYFVQVKNIRNSILFHRWYKDGQLMSKKQFAVKTNNTKLISSKKLTAKDAGQWQVVLIDKKGKLLSEANYSVNP